MSKLSEWLRKQTPWVVVVVLAVLLVGVGAWLSYQQFAAPPDLAKYTVPVTAQTLTARITASGAVVPRDTVNVSPKTAGRIARLTVEQGDRVERGALIAQMENSEQQAALVQARSAVAEARSALGLLEAGTRPEQIAQARQGVRRLEANLAQTRAQLELARTRLTRNRQLAAEGAIAADRLDEVRNQAAVAEQAVAQAAASLTEARNRLQELLNGPRPQELSRARAQLRQAQARLAQAEVQYNDTFVRAPLAGVVTQKYATVGAFVTPTTSASSTSSATSTSIVAIAAGLEVLARVPEVDIGRIREGQAVEVVADAYPGRAFAGTVRLVAPEAVIEQNVTSFQVRLALGEAARRTLRSGMNVNLAFLGERIAGATTVPTVAIVTRRGETGVLVPDEDGRPRFQLVRIGQSVGDRTQILDGIQPGARVFVDLPGGRTLEDVVGE